MNGPPMSERTATPTPAGLTAYLAVARPDHWFKNLIVVAGAAVYLWEPAAVVDPWPVVLGRLTLALLVTSLASGANYIANEILDARRDREHPVKKHRPVAARRLDRTRLWVLAALLALAALGLAARLLAWPVTLCLTAFLVVGGVVYNVPPLRAKEVPILDVLVESANGPLRLLLGWFAVTTAGAPPASFVLACWALAALVMTGKRYSELLYIGSPRRAAAYRSSFGWYTERRLHGAMVGYALAGVACFVGLALESGRLRLLWMLPFIAIFVRWFFRLSRKKDAFVREPEHIWKRPLFAVYALFLVLLFAMLALGRWPLLPLLP